MIFKTISDDTTLSGQRIVSALHARKIAQQQATTQLETDIACLKQYEVACQSGSVSTEQFDNIMKKASTPAKEYTANIKAGTGTAQSYEQAQKATNTALQSVSVGASIASKAIKLLSATMNTIAITAIFSLISNGISWVTEQIDNYIHRNEIAIGKAEKLLDTFTSDIDSITANQNKINGYADEFKELSKGVDNLGRNVSLTADEYSKYQNIVKEIVGINPSLISGYDDENNILADKNGLIETSIQLLKDEYNQKLKNLALPDNVDTAIDGAIGRFTSAKEDFLEVEIPTTLAFSGVKIDKDGNRETGYANQISQYIEDVIGVEFTGWKGGINQYILNNAEAVFDNLDNIKERAAQTKDGWEGLNDSQLIDLMDYFKELHIAYNDMNNATTSANPVLQYVAMAEDSYSELSDIQKKFVADYINGIKITSDTTAQEKNNIRKSIISLTQELSDLDDTEVENALVDLYAIPTDDQSISEFVEQFRSALEIIKAYCEENGIEIPIAITNSEKEVNELEAQYQRAVHYAKDKFNGYDPTVFFKENSINTQEEVDKWLEIAQAANSAAEAEKKYVQGSTSNETDILSEDKLEELNEQADQLSSIISEIQSSYNTLQSAVEEYNEQGYLSLDTLQSLLDMDDSYLACLVNENGQLALNTDTMNILAQAKLAEAEASAVAQAMTELYAIANGEAASSTVGYISGNASLIQSLGLLAGQYSNVATAAITAAQAQKLSAAFEAANEKDSTAANKVMTGLNAKLGLIRSTASSIKTKGLGNISSTKSTSGASSASKSAAKTMEEIQREWKEYLSKYLALYKAELDAGLIDLHTFLTKSRSMLDEFYRDGKISAKDYWDSVKDLYESQLSLYDKVLSAVTRRIDKEIDSIHDIIDGLEDQNNALQEQLDIYDSVLSEVDRVYDNEIEKLEDQKQAIQDVIDAMSDENDERERAMALQQAQYNLARALSQNSNYIYKDGQFVYTTDETAIHEAQDSFKDAQFDIDIAELEKQQDALDDYINVLEQYKNMWAEIADTYQTSQDAINATAILGQNYAQLILQNNLSDITNFKNQYVEIQAQINNNDELIQSYEEKIEYYESLKEQWSDISKAYQQAQEDQYAAMVMGANWESDVLSGRLDVLNNFKEQYIAIQQAITNAALEAARAQAAAQTAQSASGSSGGGSGGNSGSNTTSTPTKSYHVVHKLSNGFKTQGEASSKIGYYDGANGVFKDEDNQWYVYKKETYSSHMFSSISEAKDYIKKELAPWGKYGIIKYAQGTTNAKKGLNLVSEDEYGDELIINHDGTAVIAKGEQFYPFKGGETVINASETKKLLANMSNLVPLQEDASPFSRLKLHPIDYGSMVMNSLNLLDSSALSGNIINRNNSSTIKQEITFHCPNLTDKSGIEYVERELQSLTTRAMQFDWSK